MRKALFLFVGLTLAFGYVQSAEPPNKTESPAKQQKKSKKRPDAKSKNRSAGDQSVVPGQEFPRRPEKVEPRGPRTPPIAPANPNSPDPTKPTTTKPIK